MHTVYEHIDRIKEHITKEKMIVAMASSEHLLQGCFFV